VITQYQFSKLYDDMYYIADYLFKLHDPCKIKNGKCILKRKKPNGLDITYGTCCGRSCIYLSKTGCTIKCLGCKIYNCAYIRGRYRGLTKIIDLFYQFIDYDNIFEFGAFSACYSTKANFLRTNKENWDYYKATYKKKYDNTT